MGLSIEDQLAIHDLYAVYCHAIDDLDGKAFAACFTPDGSLDTGFGEPSVGADALIAMADTLGTLVPGIRHQVTNITIEGSGSDATGRAYLVAYRMGDNGYEVLITGRYQDTIQKSDGEWRFVRRGLIADAAPAVG